MDHYTSVTIITDIVAILLKCVLQVAMTVKMYGLVYCHCDKRSKGIISAIGILEKPLILLKFARSISVIIAHLGILLGIILFVSSFHA